MLTLQLSGGDLSNPVPGRRYAPLTHAAGISTRRQARYQRRMSSLLAGRS